MVEEGGPSACAEQDAAASVVIAAGVAPDPVKVGLAGAAVQVVAARETVPGPEVVGGHSAVWQAVLTEVVVAARYEALCLVQQDVSQLRRPVAERVSPPL